ATFEGLEAFAGGQAIAKVDFEGQPAASQPIPLLAETGSRVMLVRGAASANPHGGSADAGPQPGEVFPLESSPPGTLTVGAFDLQARRGLPGVEVRLVSEGEGTPPSERKVTTDAVGKAVFEGLLSSDLPE